MHETSKSLGLLNLWGSESHILQGLCWACPLIGSETWTLNRLFEKRLYGCYTRLLMKVRNIHWKKHPNLGRIYDNLPPIASVLAQHSTISGHYMRAVDQTISTILNTALAFQVARGCRPLTFLDTVARDFGLDMSRSIVQFGGKSWRSFRSWIAQSKIKQVLN